MTIEYFLFLIIEWQKKKFPVLCMRVRVRFLGETGVNQFFIIIVCQSFLESNNALTAIQQLINYNENAKISSRA